MLRSSGGEQLDGAGPARVKSSTRVPAERLDNAARRGRTHSLSLLRSRTPSWEHWSSLLQLEPCRASSDVVVEVERPGRPSTAADPVRPGAVRHLDSSQGKSRDSQQDVQHRAKSDRSLRALDSRILRPAHSRGTITREAYKEDKDTGRGETERKRRKKRAREEILRHLRSVERSSEERAVRQRSRARASRGRTS